MRKTDSSVGKQHALKPGADPALRYKPARILIDLDQAAQVVQFGCTAEVIQPVQVERGIFGQEFHIIEQTGMPTASTTAGQML